MKKAFSLMEVIICVVILSVVMITLLQIKSNNIFLVTKSEEKLKSIDYILMSISFNDPIFDKNEDILVNQKYNFENDEIKQELKDIKINLKDDKLEDKTIKNGNTNLNITTSFRTFSLENSDIKKKIYSFKIEL